MSQPGEPTSPLPDADPADDSTATPEDQEVLRQRFLMKITKRLVALTALALVLLAGLGYLGNEYGDGKTYLVIFVFFGGLIGGFVSIQQRLPEIGLGELRELSGSWLSIILIPVNGGIFAIVLHLIFLGGILQGSLFPEYKHPPIDASSLLTSFKQWLTDVFPVDGPNIAKLFFWSFAAGFSERLVPQIIRKTVQKTESGK